MSDPDPWKTTHDWYTRCERCGLEVSGTHPRDREYATGECPRCGCDLRVRHEGRVTS